MADDTTPHQDDIMYEMERYTLDEFCESCGLERKMVIEFVEYGVVDPEVTTSTIESWSFTVFALHRAQRALRLRRDLNIDLPGLSLSLDLLEEKEQLCERVRQLEQQLRALHH